MRAFFTALPVMPLGIFTMLALDRVLSPRLAAWPHHDEHLIVDWSSRTPLRREELPADPRLRLLRVEGEGGRGGAVPLEGGPHPGSDDDDNEDDEGEDDNDNEDSDDDEDEDEDKDDDVDDDEVKPWRTLRPHNIIITKITIRDVHLLYILISDAREEHVQDTSLNFKMVCTGILKTIS